MNNNTVRQCPVPKCSFEQRTRRGALLAHLRDRRKHTVIDLLNAGIDAYKVRRKNLTEEEVRDCLEWLA